ALRRQALGQRSLDLRDLAAQGKNSLPRHGGHRHDGQLSAALFLLCSYRFQSGPEESSRVIVNLFLCHCALSFDAIRMENRFTVFLELL
ncbi:MAG: hypothetical protein E5W86_30450, partial [Mesorhizobium sp.]